MQWWFRTVALRGVLLSCGWIAIAACSGPNPSAWPNRFDATPRLERILAQWRDLREQGGSCEDPRSRPPGGVRDCSQLRNALEALLFDFPNHAPLLFANAVAAYQVGERARARSYLDALFASQFLHPEGALLRGRIALEQGNLPFAQRILKEQIELAPDRPELREALASAAYLDGELELAGEQLTIAERLGAPLWRTAYHRGLLAEARSDWAAAADHYRIALEERPDWERARARLTGLNVR